MPALVSFGDELRLGGSVSTGRLDRRQRNGVDDIVNQCAARQVVHRLAHALQHRPDGDPVSGTLYRFVGGVAGVPDPGR